MPLISPISQVRRSTLHVLTVDLQVASPTVFIRQDTDHACLESNLRSIPVGT